MSRFLYLKTAPAVVSMCAIMLACANPSGDYDDFRARVSNSYDAGIDSGAVDTAPEVPRDGSIFDEAGVAAYSGEFWGACLDASYAGDLSKVTYDQFIFNFAEDAGGAVTMNGTRQGLRADATSTAKPQQVGAPVDMPSTPVDANGSFVSHVAEFIEPKESNGFGLDLTVDNGAYAFTMTSTDGGCGHFTGKVTSPLAQDVNETCIFARPDKSGAFNRITDASVLHCP
jgi:hypothetical protein